MNRIKELRIRNNVSQTDLASLVGVAASTLSGYESGKAQADIEKKKKIAEYFGVTLDYLFGADQPTGAEQIPQMFPEATDRYARLSEVDRLRVLAYMDGILSGEKYSTLSKKSVG